MSMTRRSAARLIAGAPAVLVARKSAAQEAMPEIPKGPLDGSAEALRQYRIPEWFRDAKFGI